MTRNPETTEAAKEAEWAEPARLAWEAFRAAYDRYEAENPGWRAFWTDHHAYSLDAALRAGFASLAAVLAVSPAVTDEREELAAEVERRLLCRMTGNYADGFEYAKRAAIEIIRDVRISTPPAVTEGERACPICLGAMPAHDAGLPIQDEHRRHTLAPSPAVTAAEDETRVYHPDPTINAEVIETANEAERADLATGYPARMWRCPECGTEHGRGHHLAIGQHRCLRCGYVGAGGVMFGSNPGRSDTSRPAPVVAAVPADPNEED